MSRQIVTPERIAEFRDAIANHPNFGIGGDALSKILDALEAAQAEIADLKRGGVVAPELPAETALALIAIDWPNRTIDIFATARNIREWLRKSARTIPADRVLGEGGDICFAPEDRPILAYWQHHGEMFFDVVIWRDQSDGFVCHGEHLEHEDDAVGITTIPKNAKWLDLPATLRAQPTQEPAT